MRMPSRPADGTVPAQGLRRLPSESRVPLVSPTIFARLTSPAIHFPEQPFTHYSLTVMPNANEIGKGQAIKFNGDICMVLETQHRTPGNLRAFVQATLRSMRTGKSFVQRFNSNESLEVVPMSRKKYEFSYKDNTGYHFIDPVTYDDITFQEDFVGKVKDYLTENLVCEVIFTDDKAADIEPPATVTLKIVESADGVRGDSANNVQKVAVLETGLQIQVPLFIKEGELVKISTTDGKYLGRA
jgi:elongation factor P